MGKGGGNIQSLILCSLLIMIGVLVMVLGMLADTIAANRKVMEDVQYHVRKLEYERENRK